MTSPSRYVKHNDFFLVYLSLLSDMFFIFGTGDILKIKSLKLEQTPARFKAKRHNYEKQIYYPAIFRYVRFLFWPKYYSIQIR